MLQTMDAAGTIRTLRSQLGAGYRWAGSGVFDAASCLPVMLRWHKVHTSATMQSALAAARGAASAGAQHSGSAVRTRIVLGT